MKFKTHMVLWAQTGEGFSTVCGINDDCSEKFIENAELVDFGHENETTCKRCLTRFSKMLTKHDIAVFAPSIPNNSKPTAAQSEGRGFGGGVGDYKNLKK